MVGDKAKAGYWVFKVVLNDKGFEDFCSRRYYCSACGDWQTYGVTRYCMNCGAKMAPQAVTENGEELN